MKPIKWIWGMLASFSLAVALGACSSDPSGDPTEAKLAKTISEMDGMVSLHPASLGNWDEGYVSSEGYVLVKGLNSQADFLRSLRSSRSDESRTPALSYMSVDKNLVVHVFFSEDGLPSQIAIGDNALYFNFLNDNLLELVLSTTGGYDFQTTVEYDRESLIASIRDNDYQFFFQQKLAAIVALLDNADIPQQFAGVIAKFGQIVNQELAEDPDATLQNLTDCGLIDEDGNAAFVAAVTENFDQVVVKVHYAVMLWTGKASFKVGGTSCTLSGTIHCASSDFNTYGVYGIVCDTDPEKLNVDDAEYVGFGHQEGISTHFDVDFRGLKANTTYYYRAFYRFNSEDHGDLTFKYGDPNAPIAYDTVTKEFTTGDNVLAVDVVMCIDCTGSMYDLIYTVKRNALSFYDALNNKCIENGIELSGLNNKVIGFRDINVDGSLWWEESPFYSLPDEKEDFQYFVNGLYADGGGDAPESGLEALEGSFKALENATDDGYHRQIIILWTDVSFLSSPYYTSLTVDDLYKHWEALSSGRRLIIFAPNGTWDYNDTSYEVFDGWKNVIHSTSISDSFSDFDYILDSIVDEMIGRGDDSVRKATPVRRARTIKPGVAN